MTDVAVIVPVVGRPQNAAPFMESLAESEAHVNVWAITQRDDQESVDAWLEAGALVLRQDGTTFAQKVNYGYRLTAEPWLFIVGDDVRFHPRWLTNALLIGGNRFHVVGTNDLGTARVRNGEHATHMLIRRSYVDQVGASWDGPGVVCHEGYNHWFVDDEIVTAAKQRGVWVSARSSIVEHMHPLFGRAVDDAVYRLGQSKAAADREVFDGRLAANAH